MCVWLHTHAHTITHREALKTFSARQLRLMFPLHSQTHICMPTMHTYTQRSPENLQCTPASPHVRTATLEQAHDVRRAVEVCVFSVEKHCFDKKEAQQLQWLLECVTAGCAHVLRNLHVHRDIHTTHAHNLTPLAEERCVHGRHSSRTSSRMWRLLCVGWAIGQTQCQDGR